MIGRLLSFWNGSFSGSLPSNYIRRVKKTNSNERKLTQVCYRYLHKSSRHHYITFPSRWDRKELFAAETLAHFLMLHEVVWWVFWSRLNLESVFVLMLLMLLLRVLCHVQSLQAKKIEHVQVETAHFRCLFQKNINHIILWKYRLHLLDQHHILYLIAKKKLYL